MSRRQDVISLFVIWFILSIAGISYSTGNPAPVGIGNVKWSPDNSEIAVFAENGVFIYDREFNLLRYREQELLNPAFTAGWNATGTKLAVGDEIWDAQTLDTLITIMGIRGWNSDGTQVFVLREGGREIHILDAANATLVKQIKTSLQLEVLDWSPDGTHFLVCGADAVIVIPAVENPQPSIYFQPVTGTRCEWSPDSKTIVYTGSRQIPGKRASEPGAFIRQLAFMDANTGEILYSTETLPEGMSPVEWSKHGSRLLARSSNVGYIWNTDTAELITAFSLGEGLAGIIDFSSYGTTLVTNVHNQRAASSAPLFPPARATSKFLDGTIQVIIPEASLQHLEEVQSECMKQEGAGQSNIPTVPQSKNNLGAYISQLKRANPHSISCAADLIAVAEAVLEEE